ncbi:MAG: hypothetical protein QM808_10245 [Steroidobacteraceae bacterium]
MNQKTKPSWNAIDWTLHSVRDAWTVTQTQLGDALRWSTAPATQARTWITAVNCSAQECAKRMLAVVTRS